MTLYESCVRRNALLNTALFDLLLLIMSQAGDWRRVNIMWRHFEECRLPYSRYTFEPLLRMLAVQVSFIVFSVFDLCQCSARLFVFSCFGRVFFLVQVFFFVNFLYSLCFVLVLLFRSKFTLIFC